MSALLDAQSQSVSSASQSRSDALKSLFAQLDGNGDGAISKSEFEDKLGAGGTNVQNADKVFAKLDKNGDGSVSQDELGSALKGAGKGHHHHGAKAPSSSSASADGTSADGATDPLLQALSGASSTSSSNSDGTTTTSLTYADGSKVSMTSAATGTSSAAASSSYNQLEQMIQRQANAVSFASSSATSLSMSV
jgi:Ca2+-binding EF-hand superfamily protein